MSVRIIGSSFATSALEVVILKTLHMFEVPFLLVGSFKYITSQFEVRFSATIYLVCFCFFKQLAMVTCLFWRAICVKHRFPWRLPGAGSGGAGLHLNFRVHA
jgi:oligosaccharide:H+ symporter